MEEYDCRAVTPCQEALELETNHRPEERRIVDREIDWKTIRLPK